MEHYSSKRSVHYIYPGEYIPSPELEQLAIELKKHREGAVVQPLVNVLDTTESFIVEAAIPGIKRENFLISAECLPQVPFNCMSLIMSVATGTFFFLTM